MGLKFGCSFGGWCARSEHAHTYACKLALYTKKGPDSDSDSDSAKAIMLGIGIQLGLGLIQMPGCMELGSSMHIGILY